MQIDGVEEMDNLLIIGLTNRKVISHLDRSRRPSWPTVDRWELHCEALLELACLPEWEVLCKVAGAEGSQAVEVV